MAEVVLFHHAQGLTAGVEAFAVALRDAGHDVHTPDLFGGGRTFGTIEDGMAHVHEVGFGVIAERGAAAVRELPEALVYAGFSLGVVPAQMLAQTRAGARGALLYYSCVPIEEFGPWPADLPVQVHGMADDPIFVGEGDVHAARALVAQADDAELFLYDGDDHYFADASLPSYDAEATALLLQRTLGFLARV